MITVLAVLAYAALVNIATEGVVVWAYMLGLASVTAGSAAATGHYVTWYQKGLWLLGFLLAFAGVVDSIEAARTFRPLVSSGLRDFWTALVILPVPAGALVGAMRWWVWK